MKSAVPLFQGLAISARSKHRSPNGHRQAPRLVLGRSETTDQDKRNGWSHEVSERGRKKLGSLEIEVEVGRTQLRRG